MQSARVFSIEEFSTYDGPGIRMTVFLKGCPLRCMWCHNPEGQSFERQIVRSPNGCLECGACLAAGERASGERKLTDESIAVCPRGLVRVCGEEYTSAELQAVIEKNIAILNASGGGVTFSGGEPLCHPEFLLEILKGLKGKTNRALQTCGFADTKVFYSVLEECDYVLYDLKLMDEDKHRYYTGVSNAQILENYRLLAATGKDMVTRIPLIPTVNDTEENIRATARFMEENGKSYVELLPYNKLAGGKYSLVGKEYCPEFDTERTVEPHIEIFNEYGIEVKIL
jgi:pyruvate formate lyase activating enzyme